MLRVTNLKVSLKAHLPTFSLESIVTQCQEKQLECRRYPNFVVVRYPVKVRVSFFRRGQPSDAVHVNITGLASWTCMDTVVNQLQQDFGLQPLQPIHIDNLTAVTHLDLLPESDLNIVARHLQGSGNVFRCRVNPEVFSGICIQSGDCTGLLYRSGALVLMGFNSIVVGYRFISLVKRCLRLYAHMPMLWTMCKKERPSAHSVV